MERTEGPAATVGNGQPHHGRRSTRVTLTEVAELAGVSRQTASRVARGGELVNPRTAARVRRAITKLGYRPDPVARALSTGSSQLIGVLRHETTDFGAMLMMAGVERAAADKGYGVNIASLRSYQPKVIQATVDRLAQAGSDGVILMAPWQSDARAIHALRALIPIVTISQVSGYDGPAAHADQELAAREAVEHLLGLGHPTVHHVAGPAPWNVSTLRANGWRQALIEADVEIPEALTGDWSGQSGYAAGLRLAEDPTATAVFAANDLQALGLMYALAERGLRVPEDVSVVGFDGAPGSEFFRPALTTVRVDTLEQGRQAVAQLLAAMNHEDVSPITNIPHELVIRHSTAPFRPRK
jgi:DNA-binding LacI/PurR family transcriptional regulator